MNATEAAAQAKTVAEIFKMTRHTFKVDKLEEYMADYLTKEQIIVSCGIALSTLDEIFGFEDAFQTKAFVTGGFVYSKWLPEELVNRNTDRDIFILANDSHEYHRFLVQSIDKLQTHSNLVSGGFSNSMNRVNVTHAASYNNHPYDVITITNFPIRATNTQLIFPINSSKSVIELIQTFDYYHCASGYMNGKVYTSPLAFFTAHNGILLSQNRESLDKNRFLKFAQRGYKIWPNLEASYELCNWMLEWINTPK